MEKTEIKKLRSLTSFDALVDYLRDDLDWPIEAEDAEDVAFDYSAEELGIDPAHAVKIKSIKQVRPLEDGQPWGIFYLEFESQRLPVVVLRRILKALVPASRHRDPNRPAWQMSDLLFISAQGEAEKRSVSFAHFRENSEGKSELRTFSWDSRETHLYYIRNLNLEALRWPPSSGVSNPDLWRAQWREAFDVPHRYVPKTAQTLAEEMARLAADIRETVMEVHAVEQTGGPLDQLYLSFRMTLINDLSKADFADMYAQTVAYGLFSARATQQDGFAIEDVAAMIPNTNPFLRELLEQLTQQEAVDLNELGVEQLAAMLKEVNIEAILRDFGKLKRGEDPVIHFYETFLGAYDAEKKAQRGVFYTPDAVVSFIVRSVDHILKSEFDCPDGLADTGTMEWQGESVPKVQILDPATGTGTFLQYVIQVIWDTFYKKNKGLSNEKRKEKWNRYVSEHLLPRLHGFELMMAPYTIAHMKLGLKLKETGYEFDSDERLRVYLTNALQPAHEVLRTEMTALAHEVEQAGVVKMNIPITVVMGNPPYSVSSVNKGEYIEHLIESYKSAVRKEQNIQPLSDDYVKFFRFAHEVVERTGHGIIGMITNHSYLASRVFRGMRDELLKSFSDIYVINLHGNALTGEKNPSNERDENVFDIRQGVSIILLVRSKEKSVGVSATLSYVDFWGTREKKYSTLLLQRFDQLDWQILSPVEPSFFFVPKDNDLLDEYQKAWSIKNIFVSSSTGVGTGKDSAFVALERKNIQRFINDLIDSQISNKRITEKYKVKNTSGWNFFQRRKRIISNPPQQTSPTKYQYRPFDIRNTFYHPVLRRDQKAMMQNMTGGNLALLCCQQQARVGFHHVFCTKQVVDESVISNRTRERAYVFPMRIMGSPDELFAHADDANFSPKFIRVFSKKIDTKFSDSKTTTSQNSSSESIFHYMYAILHSPAYRERYAEFLKIDFPRLPLTSNVALFRALCGLGADLVALHLQEDDYEAASWVKSGEASPLESPITTFVEGTNGSTMGSFSKSKVYKDGRVYLDTSLGEASSYFEGVPEDVYHFHIGGYQVLYKWLYDRRGKKGQPGRTLTPEDIAHYHKVVISLKETMRLMEEIDVVIEGHGGWPIE